MYQQIIIIHLPIGQIQGLPDSEANGQPSVVYSGQIIADGKSQTSSCYMSGRTNQRHAVRGVVR